MLSPVQTPGCLPPGCGLDSLLTIPQFATWCQIPLKTAQAMVRARIPGVIVESRENKRVYPRVYLEKRLKTKLV